MNVPRGNEHNRVITSPKLPVNMIMIGPPGAGKGTQAERVAAERRVPKISTGDILREAIHQGTPLGLRAKSTVELGELVSDDLIIGIVKERLNRSDARRGFVLDGFPRTVVQAKALDEILAGRDPLIIVEIVVPHDELVRRMTSRRICDECGANAGPADVKCRRCGGQLVLRSDDGNSDVMGRRLQIYTQQTEPIVNYYRKRPTFRSIDGTQTPDRVADAMAAAIDSAVETTRSSS